MRRIVILVGLIFCACSNSTLDGRVSEAEAFVGLGDYPAALSIYHDIAKHCPSYEGCARVLLTIGELESTSEVHSDAALRTYERVVELFPLKEAGRIAHERRARIHERDGDYLGAAEEYAQLLQYFSQHESSPTYLLKLGQSYLAMGNYGQARIELRGIVRARDQYPDVRPEAMFSYAETFFLEGRLGLAEKMYRRLIDQYPESPLVPEALMKTATCQEERGYLGDASETLSSARKEYPNKPVIEGRLAAMKLRGKGNVPEDVERFKRRAEEEDATKDSAEKTVKGK